MTGAVGIEGAIVTEVETGRGIGITGRECVCAGEVIKEEELELTPWTCSELVATWLLALLVAETGSGAAGLAGPVGVFGELVIADGAPEAAGLDAAGVTEDVVVALSGEEKEDGAASVCDGAEDGGVGS